jgi:hypothetical protein
LGKKTSLNRVHLSTAFDRIGIDTKRIDLVDCFGKQDLQLHQIAMLLLTEVESGGMMGQLYVESLTQVLAIHLPRHYSNFTQIITPENRSLTHTRFFDEQKEFSGTKAISISRFFKS